MSRKRSLELSGSVAPEIPSPVDPSVRGRPVARSHQSNDAPETDDEEDDEVRAKSPKRRRITRACDDCRRKKIKCDGKRPCSSCAEFNSECTYQVPSKRSKAPSHHTQRDPDKALEARLELAESLIRKFLPHIDLQGLGSHSRDDVSKSDQVDPPAEADKFIPLIQDEDQLRFTDSGEFDFHGTSSGAAFLSRITQNFPELIRYDSRIPFLPQGPRPGARLTAASFTGHSNYDYSKLPPRELARSLCDFSFNHASCLLRVVHVPSFYKRFDVLYDARRTAYTPEEGRYVGLLYSILALGSMYDVDENNPSNPDHYSEATTRGYKFYSGARFFLPDLTECRDMTSLQALLFILQFLQAIGDLNSCYNLVGVALRTALRMGLHRNLPNLRMSPIESETRKRVFHNIRQMDIYLSTTLGLPIVLQAKDIDQPLPRAIDDEYITHDRILEPPQGSLSVIQAFNAHVRLMEILATVVEHVYPSRAASRTATHATYMIDCGQLREVEKKLHDWYHNLPAIWRPGQDNDVHLIRVQILLRFAYAHVQMMLYRPFLQFFNHQAHLGNPPDQRHRAFATTGITVCRNIISIGLEIRKQAALLGSYWYILYTQFLAVLCLVSYVSHNPEKPESSEILADAVSGRGLISGLSLRSLAADRLSSALDAVFEQLPNRLGAQIQSSNSRPRHSPTIINGSMNTYNHGPASNGPSLSDSQDDWSLPNSSTPGMSGVSGHVGVNRSNSATQASSGVTTPLNHLAADRVIFPFNDPIAYPSAVAWSTSHDPTAGLSDETMHLVIPDFFGDVVGQHVPSSETAPPGMQSSTSHPASALLSMSRGGLLSDSMASIFDDLESGRLTEMARSPR